MDVQRGRLPAKTLFATRQLQLDKRSGAGHYGPSAERSKTPSPPKAGPAGSIIRRANCGQIIATVKNQAECLRQLVRVPRWRKRDEYPTK